MIIWEQKKLPSPTSLRVRHSTSTQRKRTESGRFQIRKRYSVDYEEASISFQFCDIDFQVFKGVWGQLLNNGSDWFLIDLPVGGDQPLVECKVRFISDYTYTYTNVGNSVVTAKIEFFRVEEPSSLALGNLTSIGKTEPYQGENLYLYFKKVSPADDTNAIFFINCDGVQSVYFAVQWWDGSINIYNTNSFVNKSMQGLLPNEIGKTIIWACTSATDSTPKGTIYNFICGQNMLHVANALECTKLSLVTLNTTDNLNGSSENKVMKIPVCDSLINVNMSNSVSCPIETISLVAFANNSKATGSLSFLYLDNLTSLQIDNSRSDLLPINSLTANHNNLSGTIDLRETNLRIIQLRNNNINTVILGKVSNWNGGSSPFVDLQENNITQISVVDELIFLGGVSVLRNNNLSVTAIYNYINALTNASPNPHVIQVNGNPAWVNGALDANHPDTAATLALATSKNVNIVQ